MNHPVITLSRNCLDLTKKCVGSLRSQDCGNIDLHIIDNGSTDGTPEWFRGFRSGIRENMYHFSENKGVSWGWNSLLKNLFNWADHVLVVGNDTILAPWTYSALLSADVPFVTGVDVGMSPLPAKPDVLPLSPHPDFSCFLIRRECWEKVGPFDERMVSYASDCDYHVRAHRLGIPLWKASVPYNHERSSTMRNADPNERLALHAQADRDREVFRSIYGCVPGTEEYSKLFES